MARRLIAQKPFDFSARVTLQLGRESISSSTVAISELIKNSYDADAENIEIDFYLRSEGAISTLIIKDDGLGMDQQSLVDNWLKIGTDNKVISERSKKKSRVLTGAKGLGRLGIDRLCKKLILFSKRENDNTATQLNVDWRNFENTDRSLHEILHRIYEVDLPIKTKYGQIFSEPTEKGTYLILIGVKDNWTPEFIDELSNELRLLVSPYRGANDFSINLSTTKSGDTNVRSISSEEILATAHWKVKAKVDETGRVQAKFTNNNSGEVVQLRPTEWSRWIKKEGKHPKFGPLSFEFHYLPRDLDALGRLKLGKQEWKRFMELNRGVRIYRDDFRVRPYGEPSGKGDWLDLGYRRSTSPAAIRQGGWKIGPHQIVGAVIISKEKNAILGDQANREGLFENEAFLQMRAFVIKVIEQFEVLIHKDSIRNEETDLSEELANLLRNSESEVSSALNELKSAFTKRPKSKKAQIPPAKLVFKRLQEFERAKKKHEKALEAYYEVLSKEKEKLENEKDTLSNLASIGILSVCFGHEIRTHSSLALEASDEVFDMVSDSILNKEDFNYNDFERVAALVKNSIRYVDNFSKIAINNIKPDKRNRKKVNVPSVFEYIFGLMSVTIQNMGVRYEFRYNKIQKNDFNVRSYEIDWESIAINLLTNSLWALDSTSKAERLILVSFERLGGTRLRLVFTDSGCGLEHGTEDSVFLPMSSSKRDRSGNSIGTGMGLAIVKTHVEDHMTGSVSCCNDDALGGASFTIDVLQDK